MGNIDPEIEANDAQAETPIASQNHRGLGDVLDDVSVGDDVPCLTSTISWAMSPSVADGPLAAREISERTGLMRLTLVVATLLKQRNVGHRRPNHLQGDTSRPGAIVRKREGQHDQNYRHHHKAEQLTEEYRGTTI